MPLALAEFIKDFADALVAVDHSCIPHKKFQPGVGPYGEADAVRACLGVLKKESPARYANALTKRMPDLLIPGEWAIEFKIIRPFGDNGKPAEHWSENVLHPYGGNTSSLGGRLKLLSSGLAEKKATVIFGYEHSSPQVLLESAVSSFELLAKNVMRVRLSPRCEKLRTGLIHPVHQRLHVYGYEILGIYNA